jgi:hypothetical protein
MGWNEFGYILDGSSIMFSDVQSLTNKIKNLDRIVERTGIPMSDVILMHKLDSLKN